MRNSADLITAYLRGRGLLAPHAELEAADAAMLMVLFKIARVEHNRGHTDNFIDGAAYLAIAHECEVKNA